MVRKSGRRSTRRTRLAQTSLGAINDHHFRPKSLQRRSASLPNLRDLKSGTALDPSTLFRVSRWARETASASFNETSACGTGTGGRERRGSRPDKRRWTLPSKTRPSRAVSAAGGVVVPPALMLNPPVVSLAPRGIRKMSLKVLANLSRRSSRLKEQLSSDTPAMITLQRTSSSLPRPKKHCGQADAVSSRKPGTVPDQDAGSEIDRDRHAVQVQSVSSNHAKSDSSKENSAHCKTRCSMIVEASEAGEAVRRLSINSTRNKVRRVCAPPALTEVSVLSQSDG